ncbi:unnamed protein product [Rhizopus stolonifer]
MIFYFKVRKNYLLSKKMKLNIVGMRTSMVNSLLVNHEGELHKIDLLYYHIIVFSISKSSSATYKVFTKEEHKKYNNDYRSHMNIHTEISRMQKL